MQCEFAEEIYDLITASRQTEPENERCNDDAEDLLEEYNDLQLIKSREFSLDFVAVKSVLPVIRHVVGIFNNISQSVLGLKYQIFFRDRAIHDGPEGTKYSQVEKNGPFGCDLKVEEKLRIPERSHSKHRHNCS